MKSIEFIGPPGSGKSFYNKKICNFLKKKHYTIHNFSSVFYDNYPLIYRTSIIKIFLLNIKKQINFKTTKLFKKINFLFDQFYNFENEYINVSQKRLIVNFKKNYFKILEKKEKRIFLINKLKKWLNQELPSIYISKKIKSKKKELMINSEGINQRILRLLLYYKNSDSILEKLSIKNFESDILIFVDTKPKECIKRLNKRNNNKFTNIEIKKFYNKSKLLFSRSNKIKFKIDGKINHDKLFEKVLKKIIRIQKN